MTTSRKNKQSLHNLVGLIPAGGLANRLAPLPCSKELFPIGFRRIDNTSSFRPKVVCHYLLEKMHLAGVDKAYIVVRKGKWDILDYLGDGEIVKMDLAYLILGLPFGVPYTLDQAYHFVENSRIVFGFPDIVFQPDDAFVQLLERQSSSRADIVLGLFPVKEPHKWDMVDCYDDGKIRQIVIKSPNCQLDYAWVIAVWMPTFTHFMHSYINNVQVEEKKFNNQSLEVKEIFIGEIVQAAIENDLVVQGVLFPESDCLDVGTPEDLMKAVRSFN